MKILSLSILLFIAIPIMIKSQNRYIGSVILSTGINYSSEIGKKYGNGYGMANFNPYTAYKHPITPSYYIGLKRDIILYKSLFIVPEIGVYLRKIKYNGNKDTVLKYQFYNYNSILNTSYYYTSIDLNLSIGYSIKRFNFGFVIINRMYVYGFWTRENCNNLKVTNNYMISTFYSLRPGLSISYQIGNFKPLSLSIFSRWEFWRKNWTNFLFGFSVNIKNRK